MALQVAPIQLANISYQTKPHTRYKCNNLPPNWYKANATFNFLTFSKVAASKKNTFWR